MENEILNRNLEKIINKIKNTKLNTVDYILISLIFALFIINQQPILRYKFYSFLNPNSYAKKSEISTFAQENYTCALLQGNLNTPKSCTSHGGTWGKVSHKCFCLNADVL